VPRAAPVAKPLPTAVLPGMFATKDSDDVIGTHAAPRLPNNYDAGCAQIATTADPQEPLEAAVCDQSYVPPEAAAS
jgi:hypothetical protein